MKTHLIQFRIQKDKDEELSKIATAINLDKSKFIRLLFNEDQFKKQLNDDQSHQRGESNSLDS